MVTLVRHAHVHTGLSTLISQKTQAMVYDLLGDSPSLRDNVFTYEAEMQGGACGTGAGCDRGPVAEGLLRG